MSAYLETRYYPMDFPIHAFYASDNCYLAHWHIDVEMVYVCEGSIRIGINKDVKILKKGEFAVFRSTDIHYYDSTNLSSKIIVLIFRPEIIEASSGWPEKLRFDSPFMVSEVLDKVSTEIQADICGLFHSIVEETNERKPFFELLVRGKISELCALLLRNFPSSPSVSKGNQKLPDIERIQYVIQYLENNYAVDISLEHISEKAGFSQYYFSRLFKKFTGINFKEYLTRIRIDKAETLIKSTGKSFTDICFECGFNSVRTFNRSFKSVKGYAPSKLII